MGKMPLRVVLLLSLLSMAQAQSETVFRNALNYYLRSQGAVLEPTAQLELEGIEDSFARVRVLPPTGKATVFFLAFREAEWLVLGFGSAFSRSFYETYEIPESLWLAPGGAAQTGVPQPFAPPAPLQAPPPVATLSPAPMPDAPVPTAVPDVPTPTAVPDVPAPSPIPLPEPPPPPLRYEALGETDCESLRSAFLRRFGLPVARTVSDFQDPLTAARSSACTLLLEGSGRNFVGFVDLTATLRRLMESQGWQEDGAYLEARPTGGLLGFRNGEAFALVSHLWLAAEETNCPADQLLSACVLPPEARRYTLRLDAVVPQSPPTGTPPASPRRPAPPPFTPAYVGSPEEAQVAEGRARALLAEQLVVGQEAVTTLSIEGVIWPDSCLGLRSAGLCAQVLTPGYRVVLEVVGQHYVVHTDASARSLRRVQP